MGVKCQDFLPSVRYENSGRKETMEKDSKIKQIIWKQKGWLALVVIATCAYTASELMKAYVMQLVLDSATQMSGQLFQKAFITFVLYLPTFLLTYIFLYFCREKFIVKCSISIKNQWFADIQKKQLCDYDMQEASTYISHFTVDIKTIEEDYIGSLLSVIQDVIVGVASLGAILKVHYTFVLAIVLSIYLPVFVSSLWGKRLEKTRLEASETNGKMVALIKELMNGFEVSTLFGIRKKEEKKFQKMNEETGAKAFDAEISSDAAAISSGTASIAIFFGNMFLGVLLVLKGLITLGQAQYVIQLMNNVVNPLHRIGPYLAEMKTAEALYQQVSEKLQKHTEISEAKELSKFVTDICLDGVYFAKNERTILDQVRVSFQKNQKYLLVGESGSGKSSLLKILLNMYGDYDGKVSVDGNDFQSIDKESWYRCLSVVSQDGFVYHDTLLNNITLYQEYSKEEIDRVIALCNLEEFVASHEEAFEFLIEENGKNISGGERQRICLARALIRRPSILILDEATSALNSEMARQIEENILGLEDTTIIAVSHRIFPELREKYDSVIRFENHKAVLEMK